ncbi:MAG: SPOR domain-containing protein [Bacteroidetes bacterium]|nr:SPOR domain-containing protein [Bacteroidota bacterium]
MIQFEEAIVDLLLRHNCVIVPTFGGFVAQSTNAVVDFRNGIMMPPRKSVLFNKQLINNDGLLLHYLAEKNTLKYSEAEEKVKSTINNWNLQLKEGKRIVIDKIGYLYLDSERNISFEQDRFFNLLLQSYGLNKVHFLVEEDVKRVESTKQPEQIILEPKVLTTPVSEPIVELEPKIIPITQNMPKPAAEVIPVQEEEPTSKRAWRYLAAAALLPFAFYTYWIPMKTNVLESGVLSTKDFNPSYQAGEGVYQKKGYSFSLKKEKKELTLQEAVDGLPENVNVYFYKFTDDLYIPVRIDKNLPEEVKVFSKDSKIEKVDGFVVNKPDVKTEEKPEVVTPKVAQKPEVKTKPTEIAQEAKAGSLHLVVGCFSTEQNANDLVQDLKSKGFNALVLPQAGKMFRVSAGSATNNTEMSKVEAKAKNIGLSGWVLK